LDLSQEALAERASLHRTYIAGIEAGMRNVTLKTMEKLAHALQVPTATLLLDAAGPVGRSELARSAATNGKHEPREILVAAESLAAVELTARAFQQARIINPLQAVYDGQEALDFLFRTGRFAERKPGDCPQLVLLDVNLPKVSGLEVLRRLKADGRTRRIPVVVLTDSGVSKAMAECKRLGAETWLMKPLNFKGLAAALQKLGMSWLLLDLPLNL